MYMKMIELKQHVFPIAFYILTIFMMVECEGECDMKIHDFDLDSSDCFIVHHFDGEFTDHLNYIKCENINLTEEILSNYKSRKYIQIFDISGSIISTLEPFKSACILKLSNVTMNISKRHVLNEPHIISLSIRSSNLSTFDLIPISSLSILDLSDNALTSLNTTNFRNFKLDKLNVSSNRLSNMYCENVKDEINLSSNGLNSIICKFATSLKHLYLNNNHLSNISKDAFKGMHNLRLLDLSDNQLDDVAYIFSDLDSLLLLFLRNNSIYDVRFGSFLNLKLLEHLDLSYNEIVTLYHGIFNGLDNLKSLDLSYNDMFELDVGILYPTHVLKELYLEGNFLQDLDVNSLRKFSYLKHISFTFADISCHKLKNYVDIFESNNVEIKVGEYFYLDNVHGIKCIARGTTDLYKSSLELSLNSLEKIHKTLTIIAVCFLVIMLMFLFIRYYKYKM